MFLLFNIVLFLIIVFLLIILSWVWPPNSPWAPWWRTNKKTAKAICELADLKEKDIVYDLGCGDGTALLMGAKYYRARGVGIEIEPTRALIAKLRMKLNKVDKKVVMKRKNLFDEDLSAATVIIVYLVPKTLNMLIPKLKKECKKGTKIVSYRYEMKLTQKKHDKENQLRMYVL